MYPVDEAMLVREAQKLRTEMVGNAVKSFGGWLARHRLARASRNEFAAFGSHQAAAIARDLGIDTRRLRALSNAGPSSADLLNRMLGALGIDPKSLKTMDVCTARDLQSVCSVCESKSRCRRALAAGTAATTYRQFCPNAATLDTLPA